VTDSYFYATLADKLEQLNGKCGRGERTRCDAMKQCGDAMRRGDATRCNVMRCKAI
jgi:hypothetical protein